MKELEKSWVTLKLTEMGRISRGAGLGEKISSSIWDMSSFKCLLNTLQIISAYMIFKSMKLKDTTKKCSIKEKKLKPK